MKTQYNKKKRKQRSRGTEEAEEDEQGDEQGDEILVPDTDDSIMHYLIHHHWPQQHPWLQQHPWHNNTHGYNNTHGSTTPMVNNTYATTTPMATNNNTHGYNNTHGFKTPWRYRISKTNEESNQETIETFDNENKGTLKNIVLELNLTNAEMVEFEHFSKQQQS